MIEGNDRNVTNRRAYEQNAWKKAFWAVEWSSNVLNTITNTSSNFEVEPLQCAAARATSSIVSDVVVVFFLQNLNVTWLERRFARNDSCHYHSFVHFL